MNRAVQTWLLGSDTGTSSRKIVTVMEGISTDRPFYDYPVDLDDLGRCVRLLDIAPEYRARLPEMAIVCWQWAALVENWDALEAQYRKWWMSKSQADFSDGWDVMFELIHRRIVAVDAKSDYNTDTMKSNQ